MKKLFSKIAALGALMVGALAIGGAAHKAPVTAKAAGEWSVTFKVDVSTVASWNPAPTDYRLHTDANVDSGKWDNAAENFTATSTTNIWERKITFASNDSMTLFVFYFKQSGTIKQSGDVLLSLNSSNDGETYKITCNPDGWSGNHFNSGTSVVKEGAPKRTITYYDGSVSKGSDTYDDGALFDGKFFKKQGYRLLGWYTTSTFASGTEFKKGDKVSGGDLKLYAKYELAEDYYVYLKNTLGWGTVRAYMWADKLDGHNNNWDAAPTMTKVAGTTNLYSIKIDASESYDNIIFHNGGNGLNQSVDFDLATTNVVYSFDGNDGTNQKLKEDTFPREVIAYVTGDDLKIADLGYSAKADKVDIAALTLVDGKVGFDSNVTPEEAKAALIARMQKVDTCNDYARYAEFRELAEKVDGYESIEIADKDQATGATTARVSIGDKLAYMELLANTKSASVNSDDKLNNALLSLSDNGNVSLVALFAILGLVAVSAYYFIEKRKLAK